MGLGPPRTFMNLNASLLIYVSSGELAKQQRLLQWYASFCVINFRAPLTTVWLLCARIGEAANELPRRDSLTAQTGALFEELWYSISHQWQTLFLCHKNNDNRIDFMAGLLRSKWPREFQSNETKERRHLCSSCEIRSLVAVMEFCLMQIQTICSFYETLYDKSSSWIYNSANVYSSSIALVCVCVFQVTSVCRWHHVTVIHSFIHSFWKLSRDQHQFCHFTGIPNALME